MQKGIVDLAHPTVHHDGSQKALNRTFDSAHRCTFVNVLAYCLALFLSISILCGLQAVQFVVKARPVAVKQSFEVNLDEAN